MCIMISKLVYPIYFYNDSYVSFSTFMLLCGRKILLKVRTYFLSFPIYTLCLFEIAVAKNNEICCLMANYNTEHNKRQRNIVL